MFELKKAYKGIVLVLLLVSILILASKLRQIKMDFSTQQLEINFDNKNTKQIDKTNQQRRIKETY